MHDLELKVPPIAVALTAAALMWVLAATTPAFDFQIPGAFPIFPILAFIGGMIAVSGIMSFRRSKTTVNPMKPDEATSLVTSGIYRITRNPMYLGLLFILLGWGAFLENVLAFVPVPVFVLYLTRFQIIPEERFLTVIFGEAYTAYCAQVRRWL